MVFEEWGPTLATLGSCYPLLCPCSWGDFNECSCSIPLLAPVRLQGYPHPSSPLLNGRACTTRLRQRKGSQVIELNNWWSEFTPQEWWRVQILPRTWLQLFSDVRINQSSCVFFCFIQPSFVSIKQSFLTKPTQTLREKYTNKYRGLITHRTFQMWNHW